MAKEKKEGRKEKEREHISGIIYYTPLECIEIAEKAISHHRRNLINSSRCNTSITCHTSKSG